MDEPEKIRAYDSYFDGTLDAFGEAVRLSREDLDNDSSQKNLAGKRHAKTSQLKE